MNFMNFLAAASDQALDLETGACNSKILPIFAAAKFVIRIIQIAVPFALVIWGSLDWFKALIAGDEKEMKQKRKPFIARLVAAIVILILPWLVELVAGQMVNSNDKTQFWACYNGAKARIDFSCWNEANKECVEKLWKQTTTTPTNNNAQGGQ